MVKTKMGSAWTPKSACVGVLKVRMRLDKLQYGNIQFNMCTDLQLDTVVMFNSLRPGDNLSRSLQ